MINFKEEIRMRNWRKDRMDIKNFKKESEKVCYYCGKQIVNKGELTVDHVVPVSKGGETAKDNFVISCKACNTEKASLNAERYAEFLSIMSTMEENNGALEVVEKAIGGFKEIMINFNGELYAAKNKLAALEKKRSAVLDSMMFKKFNVVKGYDYAKELRDLTEEIHNLKLNISQMNKLYGGITQFSAFINNANPKGIAKEAMQKMRGEILSDYRIFADEKPAAENGTGNERTE